MELKTLSAEEALGRLSVSEREAVGKFILELRQEFADRVKDIRIFGSKIRGDSHPESDIDLLVLIDSLKQAEWERIVDMAYFASASIDAKVTDYDGYHSPASRATGFYKEMREESVRL